MPKTVTIHSLAFDFDELEDSAKETARKWYRGCIDSNDFDCEIGEFKTVCEHLGIDFDTHEVTGCTGKKWQEPNIYWSVGCCQSDYASFEGVYTHRSDAVAKLRAINDSDDWEPIKIAEALARVQADNFFGLRAIIKTRNYGGASVEVEDGRDEYRDDAILDAAEKEIRELMERLARYLYEQLRDQSDHLYSDEAVDESIAANEYKFNEDGSRHAYA